MLARWVQVNSRFIEKEYVLAGGVVTLPRVKDGLQRKKVSKAATALRGPDKAVSEPRDLLCAARSARTRSRVRGSI